MPQNFLRHIAALSNVKDPRAQAARDFLIEMNAVFDGLEANSEIQASITDTALLNIKDVAVQTMLKVQLENTKAKVRNNLGRMKNYKNILV